jgi:ATP-dependent RNA helicase DDX31/DBP7
MNDDIVLNIATTRPADRHTPTPATTANSSRRNKYSFAAKKERANSAKKPQF